MRRRLTFWNSQHWHQYWLKHTMFQDISRHRMITICGCGTSWRYEPSE